MAQLLASLTHVTADSSRCRQVWRGRAYIMTAPAVIFDGQGGQLGSGLLQVGDDGRPRSSCGNGRRLIMLPGPSTLHLQTPCMCGHWLTCCCRLHLLWPCCSSWSSPRLGTTPPGQKSTPVLWTPHSATTMCQSPGHSPSPTQNHEPWSALAGALTRSRVEATAQSLY